MLFAREWEALNGEFKEFNGECVSASGRKRSVGATNDGHRTQPHDPFELLGIRH